MTERFRWFLLIAGHLLLPVYPPLLIGITLLDYVLYGNGAWTICMILLLPPVMCSIVGHVLVHASTPCGWCIRAVPLNPGKAVEAKRHWLRLCHWMVQGKRIYIPMVGWLISTTASLVLGHPISNTLTLFLFAIPMAALMTARKWHGRLQPWCPYCWRGDGEEEPASPDPRPANV